MLIALAVALFSLIPFAWMVNTAVSEGFTFFVVPLVVLELLFLLAVVCIWRALAADDDEPEPRPWYTNPPRSEGTQHEQPRRTAATDTRRAAWADWWFNGLRDSHRQG